MIKPKSKAPQSILCAFQECYSSDLSAADLRTSIEQLKERTEVTESQIKQHDQTKVESASKYPLRISGMLLFRSECSGFAHKHRAIERAHGSNRITNKAT